MKNEFNNTIGDDRLESINGGCIGPGKMWAPKNLLHLPYRSPKLDDIETEPVDGLAKQRKLPSF